MPPADAGPDPSPNGAGLAEAVLGVTDTLVVVLDPAGRVVRFNPACERLTGLTFEEVRGQVLWPFVLAPEEVAGVTAAFAALTAGDFPGRYENHWRAASGERRYILWSNTALLDPAGEVALVVATGMDVTAERQAEQARQESEAQFRVVFDQSADGLVLLDPHDPQVPWRIVDCNAAFCAMNGYAREELLGQSIDLLHPEPLMARRGPELLAWIRAQQPVHGEGEHRHKDGHVFPVETASSTVLVGGREHVLGQDRDISGRRQAQAQLEALAERLAFEAQHDALTGLPNRARLLDRLALELRRAERTGRAVAVMFIDLDGFKRVNDTLGHAAGDALLREVAARLQACVRPSDTVARLGGDEFVAVVSDLESPQDAARVAGRLQAALAPPVVLGGTPLSVRSSLGIALHPPDSAVPDDLLRQADMAMYQAKREGKNATRFFAPTLDTAAHTQLRIEGRLRRALEAPAAGGLHLHYQPQVDARSGAPVGFEALLRWTDAELGAVSPARFIPVAEDSGLISALGAWVLDEACRQVAAWGLQVPVAVNVSPLEVSQEEFLGTVYATLRRHGLGGPAIKLELTERLAVRDLQLAARRLSQLRALGVHLSLDDFGTGQSSVSTLLHLPVDELKLDRSLILGVADSALDRRVVGALLALARGLNLRVVVEGVETQAQLAALRDLGCETVQGYLTGRPAPPEALASVVAQAR
ncbi:putative bifunctional diguanylate cyclase/phosphodiesterase [Deinococcus aquaedulcis]|uniref:putative bifunctional diguanylate cyclase/phosphodiesterase n=1 Tax=Deinococcus aquaedulcis TaxID=2840455 RepID=UPI001C82E7DA|nr:bifunctional diguanylate cyclase/phosphodiesterase [Deinococcus aquaedulcis]